MAVSQVIFRGDMPTDTGFLHCKYRQLTPCCVSSRFENGDLINRAVYLAFHEEFKPLRRAVPCVFIDGLLFPWVNGLVLNSFSEYKRLYEAGLLDHGQN